MLYVLNVLLIFMILDVVFFVHDCIRSSQFNTASVQTNNYYEDHFQ